MRYKIILTFVLSIYALTSFFVAKSFPPVNSDEVIRSLMGTQKIDGIDTRYSLYDGVFAQSVYEMRDVMPETLLSLYHYWLGLWAYAGNESYLNFRIASIIAGLLALIAFYSLGSMLGGKNIGLVSAALAGFSPLFLFSSSLVRPENLLIFTSTATIWLVLKVRDEMSFKPFLIGIIAFIPMGIHPNAAVIGVGLLTFYLLGIPWSQRSRKGALSSAGAALGIFSVLIVTNPYRLWLGMNTIYSHLLKPPIADFPWNPFRWLGQTAGIIWSGRTYYFDADLVAGWSIGQKLWWMGIGATLFLAIIQKKNETEKIQLKRWLISLSTVFLFTLMFVKAKDCIYGTNFFPFLIPISALYIGRWSGKTMFIGKMCGIILLTLSVLFSARFFFDYRKKTKPYTEITREIRAMIPGENDKVAGPAVLWFAWDNKQFRDSGSLLLSHWYTGGKWNIEHWLSGWKPDILILDQPFINRFKKAYAYPDELTSIFDGRIFHLGTIDTFSAYGKWDVFRISWPQPDSAL